MPVGAPALTIAQISASTTIADRSVITGLRRTSGTMIDHTAQIEKLLIGEAAPVAGREGLRPMVGRLWLKWMPSHRAGALK